MKLFIFLVFAMAVFARESFLSSVLAELIEERLADKNCSNPLGHNYAVGCSEEELADSMARTHARHGGRRQLAREPLRESLLSSVLAELIEERLAKNCHNPLGHNYAVGC